MSWHADPQTLTRYATGDVDDAVAFSIETHLTRCPSCRALLAPAVDPARLERLWRRVADDVDRPRRTVLERLLAAVGVGPHLARLIAATPALRPSWIVAVAATLAFAVVAARAIGDGPLVFLVLAPVIPVAGVALAYGAGADPAYEVALASPLGGFRLLLLRAAAVLLTSEALAGVAALAMPGLGWTAAAWLLPSLALTFLTLALSTAFAPRAAVGAVALTWIAGVTAVERLAHEPFAAFGPPAQLLFAAITVASVALVVVRRREFDLRRLL